MSEQQRIAFALIELAATVQEYRDMPCDSLRKRMFDTLDRYATPVQQARAIALTPETEGNHADD